MPSSEAQLSHDLPGVEVLTLPETAAYLRVPEAAILELVEKDLLPAQQIGGEWRFLKGVLIEFLRFGPHPSRKLRMFPHPWMFEHPFWEEMFWALEQRVLTRLGAERSGPKPGSKEAVLRHVGVFKDDDDLEEQLAGIRARREAAGE